MFKWTCFYQKTDTNVWSSKCEAFNAKWSQQWAASPRWFPSVCIWVIQLHMSHPTQLKHYTEHNCHLNDLFAAENVNPCCENNAAVIFDVLTNGHQLWTHRGPECVALLLKNPKRIKRSVCEFLSPAVRWKEHLCYYLSLMYLCCLRRTELLP